MKDIAHGYGKLLKELKEKIGSCQIKAAISVNKEMVLLYWDVGNEILKRQKMEGWGTKVIDRLSCDLTKAFPRMMGFSPRNIKYMRAFAETYSDRQFVQQVVAQIPWGHNVRILDYVKDRHEREWYIRKTIENGWSRGVLLLQIENQLHKRQSKAITNFDNTLPKPQSDLARQTLKDPYIFDFLTVGESVVEKEIEAELVLHLKKFLLELGAGFAFVGEQVHLDIGGEDYYIDLLFYHTKLHCYVVIELKAVSFRPEFAGKINFYLSAIDDQWRNKGDNPSIGLILCKSKNHITAEYALRDISKPIGIAKWQTKIVECLPKEFKGSLPTIEEIESGLKK